MSKYMISKSSITAHKNKNPNFYFLNGIWKNQNFDFKFFKLDNGLLVCNNKNFILFLKICINLDRSTKNNSYVLSNENFMQVLISFRAGCTNAS
jgi:hypothetical protein